MSQLDLVSIVYTIVQYVALTHSVWRATGIFLDSTKKKTIDQCFLTTIWLLVTSFLWAIFTLFVLEAKRSDGTIQRDDIVLPVLYCLVTVSIMWKIDYVKEDIERARSVEYMVKKYGFELASVSRLVEVFKLERFPIDSFERAGLALTDAQRRENRIDDAEILLRATAEFSRLMIQVDALSTALPFARDMRIVSASSYEIRARDKIRYSEST
jgi:hypothetical protein